MKKTTKKIIKGIQIVSVAGLTTMMLCENVTPVSGQTEMSAFATEMSKLTWNTMTKEQQSQLESDNPELAKKMKEEQAIVDAAEAAKKDAADTSDKKDSTKDDTTENPTKGDAGENPTKDDTTDDSPKDDTTDDSPKDDSTDDSTKDDTTDDSPKDDTTDDLTKDDTTDNTTETLTKDDSVADKTEETTKDNTTVKDDKKDEDKKVESTTSSKKTKEDAEVETASNSKKKITDTKAEAVYTQKDYNPSEAFISKSQKITYNESVPIEGLPKFITQEMVIGALKCQDETGYPASVTIAQIIQESGFGKYGDGGASGQGLSYLAYQYCNLFGIKGTGTAGSVSMKTGEQKASGERYTITAGFRAYHTYTECLEDRTQLLQRVYGDLTAGVTDANTFAMKIGGRWATSISYGQNLIQQMKYYDLYRLDKMTLQDFSKLVGTFTNPCPGAKLTSGFGYRSFDDSFHKGIDLGTGNENIPTYAVASGTVIQAGWSDSAGNWVVIDHGNGLVTKYMHHLEIYVKVGQKVQKGQQIGLSGTTGKSTGNHLHFQVEENGIAVDPTPYLSGKTTSTVKMSTTTESDNPTAFDESIFSKIRVRLTKKNSI